MEIKVLDKAGVLKDANRKPVCDGVYHKGGLLQSKQCTKEAFIMTNTKTGLSVHLCHFCNWLNMHGVEWNPNGRKL